MTDSTAVAAEDPVIGQCMQAIAAGLQAAGLIARVHETCGVLDIAATVPRPGGKETKVIVDEDGYVEIRYWSLADVGPDQVTAVITRALAAIAAAQRT